ncbi:MAG: hypothetical protein ACI8P3_001772 [Saprospiraceae bacterium]|jgi:hypothetical protein
MTHYQNTHGVFRTERDPLIEQVFSILDSRIQFIDFQVQRYFQSCTSDICEAPKNEFTYSGPSSSSILVNNLDQLLNFTEELQNDLKLLQTLKAWLKDETVHDILDLLTNNKYLQYSEEKLDYFLKKKALAYFTMAMERA